MPFCKDCGKPVDEEARFCPHCGAPNALAGPEAEQGAVGAAAGSGALGSEGDGPSSGDLRTAKRVGGGPYGAVRLEALPEGYVIDNRYEIKSKLGQGGFGAVYLAHDRKMAIDKALKIIPDSVAADEEAMGELHAEARTMVSLNNEHIVRVYDVHDTGTIKYIDMEYVAGKALSKVKLEKAEKKLSEKEVKALGVKIARGMAYAHRNKVIHKDIKPQNIMVTDDGAVKIMDFGISEAVRTSMSRVANSSSSGTLVYMSPEQVKGQDVGRESDIYSFGAMLYELLCGHPPFYKGAIEYQIFNERPADLTGVSPELNGMIQKCLEKDYRARYRSFEEVEAVLLGRALPAGRGRAVSPEDAGNARKETVGDETPGLNPEATVRRTGSAGGAPAVRGGQAAWKKRLPLFIGIGGAVAAAVLVMIFVSVN